MRCSASDPGNKTDLPPHGPRLASKTDLIGPEADAKSPSGLALRPMLVPWTIGHMMRPWNWTARTENEAWRSGHPFQPARISWLHGVSLIRLCDQWEDPLRRGGYRPQLIHAAAAPGLGLPAVEKGVRQDASSLRLREPGRPQAMDVGAEALSCRAKLTTCAMVRH